MNQPDFRWIAMCRILKPLACGVRLGVFALLDKDDQSIEQLAQKSQLCDSTVSRHLRVLHGSGLIKKTMHGQQVFYRLDRHVCLFADELKKMTNCILTKQCGSN